MKRKTDKRNNRGFTLVELLVAIAILSIIVGAVVTFFMRTMSLYHGGNEESDLQNEAQMTITQIENLVVNASQGVGLNPSLPNTQTSGNELYVYNRIETGGTPDYQVIHLYVNGAKLLYDYMKYAIDPSTGTYTLSNDPLRQTQTLSNYITNFTVDVSELVSKNRIRFSIAFKTKGGKEYNTNNTVLLRNKILDKTNGNPDDYFAESIADDAKREVTQMELTPSEFSMWAGTSVPCPFTPVFKKADGTVSDKGSAMWTIFQYPSKNDGSTADANINRSTGAMTVSAGATGTMIIQATEQGSIDRNGFDDNKYVFKQANVYIKSVSNVAQLTTPTQNSDNLSVAYATFTITGNHLTPEDLAAIKPTVMAGSSPLTVSITADAAASSFDQDAQGTSTLVYKVSVNRPGNYLGKTYTLGIQATAPGNVVCSSTPITWSFIATPGDEDKVVSAVKLVDTKGLVNSEGGSVSVPADRGASVTLVMYVKYKDKDGNETDFTPLSADSWSIKQSGTPSASSAKCDIVPSGTCYLLNTSAKDYAKDFSMDFTTIYSSGQGQEKQGPSLRLNFSKVKFSVRNVLGNQSVFPVTAGKTSNIQFEIQGLSNGSVYVQSGSHPGLSITTSGESASVTAKSNASVDTKYTFGLKDSVGHVIEGVTCDVTVWPAGANTSAYNGSKSDHEVYIPTVSEIGDFDPTKTAPESGKTITIFMPDGEKVTYTNQNKAGVDGAKHKYWAEYKGKTYYYVSTAHQWRLNEK